MNEDRTKYINEKEVSKITGRAIQSIRNDRFNGRGLPYVRWGNRFIRYNLEDVLEFMEKRKISTEG